MYINEFFMILSPR